MVIKFGLFRLRFFEVIGSIKVRNLLSEKWFKELLLISLGQWLIVNYLINLHDCIDLIFIVVVIIVYISNIYSTAVTFVSFP